MNMAQTPSELRPSRDLPCPYCNAVLPAQATFCATCGERVVKHSVASLLQDEADINSRYRITSLARRRPSANLLFAVDTQQQLPVAMRDVDINGLHNEAQAEACEIVQREYDVLRREQVPSLMAVMDVRHFQGHLYVIAGWPYPSHRGEDTIGLHLHTLQDVLQSGIGLPGTHVSLSWIEGLCCTLDALHRRQMVAGDLDPQSLILGDSSYDGDLALMVCWLPAAMRGLLSPSSVIQNTTNFMAPEVLLGKPEPRSDIYSLGAVLYLLLTGRPPEEPLVRMHRRLRSPAEFNARINGDLDAFVMKALSLECAGRFPSASAMLEALSRLGTVYGTRKGQVQHPAASPSFMAGTDQAPLAGTLANATAFPKHERSIEEIANTDTVVITPLPEASRVAWAQVGPSPPVVEDSIQRPDHPQVGPQEDEVEFAAQPIPSDEGGKHSFVYSFKQRMSGMLQAVPGSQTPQTGQTQSSVSSPQDEMLPMPSSSWGEINQVPTADEDLAATSSFRRSGGDVGEVWEPLGSPAGRGDATRRGDVKDKQGASSGAIVPVPAIEPWSGAAAENDNTFLKRLRRLVQGEQRYITTTAAIIETPMRIQPNQAYTMRIQLMGRNGAGSTQGTFPASMQGRDTPGRGGLSALVEGELVHIEVRSALYQNYAYIVQQTMVAIPASGFVAEVTIPLQPLSSGASGRRDRLHVFFIDGRGGGRRPLYEKPFVVELFISHLVQPGREGHQVLTIPL